MSPLPAPGDPAAPKYWKYETSGVLAHAVETYLTHRSAVTMRDIAYLRAYCMQWIDSPAWDTNPHLTAASMRELADLRLDARAIFSLAALDNWIARAIAEGVDPL
jgi:hypothetical protein